MIFTITGSSGSGKTTLVKQLLKRYPKKYHMVITTTTREKREGEVNGRDYHFVSKETFKRELEMDRFVEHTRFGDNFYGSHECDIEAAFYHQKHALMILDAAGARSIKKAYGNLVRNVYLEAPQADTLKRLARRDGWKKAKQRMRADKEASLFISDGYDCILRNDGSKKHLAENFNNYVIAMEFEKGLAKKGAA